MRVRSTRTRSSIVLLALVGVATTLVLVWLTSPNSGSLENRDIQSNGEIRLQPDSYYDDPWVYFFGDSYVTGTVMDSGVQWPALVTESLGWYGRNFGSAHAGYLVPGADGVTILDRINGTRLEGADAVVLAAGLEDAKRGDGTKIGPAILATLLRVRELAPDAEIIVLSVIAPSGSQKLDDINTLLARVSHRVDATYVDVTGLLTSTQGALGSDGVYPTDLGHRIIAEKVNEDVAQRVTKTPR